MSRPILEVIALDADDAVAAQAGGADRLELVTDMAADGLTPPREVFAAVRDAVDLPVRVMLRSRDGFGTGGAAALDALCADAEALRAEGAREFVFGFLDDTGEPDLAALTTLTGVIGGCAWTFHRAIDHAADRDRLRAGLAGLPGLDTYLTAGSADGVDEGLPVLLTEVGVAVASGGLSADAGAAAPRTLIGGGLRAAHLPTLRAAGHDAFHVGGAVRTAGWTTPVSPTAVSEWRTALDAPLG